ncbi:lysophospholipid acyltransferase family protein [Kiloniella sp. b19]|uniref:lysophospholipid acyltransferase family protein n=1 Tax=Kiloniella sp. GXU_MW_B19 TaxID=3141326 RepID=UPI0031E02ADF
MIESAVASGFGSPVRASFRLFCYLVFTLSCLPVHLLISITPASLRGEHTLERFIRFYHQACCFITGIKVEIKGDFKQDRSTLFVSNHVSYLDIMVLGSSLNAAFVAKAEVSKWPFFGFLARLGNTVFVERRRSRAAKGRDDLAKRLSTGRSLILFPEGTSSDGTRVLPFRSSLFAVGEQDLSDEQKNKTPVKKADQPLLVQPISITYTRLDGMPLERCFRPFYAWYGDMELAGHLWHALSMGVLTVQVECHEPVLFENFSDRKELASYCQKKVAVGVSRAMAHRCEAGFDFSLHDMTGNPLAL